jgi:DNA-binding NarL/FixJ family response regulator
MQTWSGTGEHHWMIKKRIFIACEDELLRIALLLRLENEPGMVVVGITDRLENLLLQMEASQANVLLLEWELTLGALKDLMDKIHQLSHPYKTIYFAGEMLDNQEQFLAAGVDHIIFKNAPPDELLPILNKIELQSTNV